MATFGRQRCGRNAARRRLSLSNLRTPLDEIVREQIRRDGPMLYGDVVEQALYHSEHGFYANGGRAGRRGDFLTSPEVGPLFGHVLANALDEEWDRLGQPERFTVIDWGAGPGTLLRAVRRAQPRCSDAITYVGVERSEAQRALHDGEVEAVANLEPEHRGGHGVIVANELLDNLAFTPVKIEGTAVLPAMVELAKGSDELVVTHTTPRNDLDSGLFSPGAAEAVWQPAASVWLTEALDVFDAGRVICIDYARTASEGVEIRTFAQHGEAGDPLAALGSKDITVDVDLAQLQVGVKEADELSDQADWLERLGIDDLVEEGRRKWATSAGQGTLEALWARSRVRESEALLDRSGLGGFTVAEWRI